MSPLPGWKTIPDGWAEHHALTLKELYTGQASFERISDGPAPYPVPPGWTGREKVWESPVRLQAEKRGGVADQAEQPQTVREYTLQTPLGGPALRVGERGDVVVINGKDYRLLSEQASTVAWERLFTVSLNQTQNGV